MQRPAAARLLGIVIGVSFLLHVALAWQGGQYFFPDEVRYERGVTIVMALYRGDLPAVAGQLSRPDHCGFTFVNTAVAVLHHLLAQATIYGNWSNPANMRATLWIAGIIYAIFPAVNLWLVHRIARGAGAGDSEALWATLLAAASNTLFYSSRHLTPYDCSLTAALAGLYCVLRQRPGLAGAWASLSFTVYNGYWFLSPLLLLALLGHPAGWTTRVRAVLLWGTGYAAALALAFLPGLLADARSFWGRLVEFSSTVRQGLFREGWSLPWEYFWHTEGWFGLFLAAAMGSAAWVAASDAEGSRRARRWLGLFAATYLLLVIMSVGLKKFVIYGRTAHPLVPLACLAAATGVQHCAGSRRRLNQALAVLVIGGALARFAPSLMRLYPLELEQRVLQEYGMPKRVMTFSGSIYHPLQTPRLAPDLALVNAQLLCPVRSYLGYPHGEVIFSCDHPLNYLPYQYAGYTPRERALLREHPPLIQLVRLADPAAVPFHPPDELLYNAGDNPDGYDRQP
jgi:hypothetical protein